LYYIGVKKNKIREKIKMDFTKYENTLKYPEKPKRPDRPKDIGYNKPSEEFIAYGNAIIDYGGELQKFEQGPWAQYVEARDAHNKEASRLFELFKQDCLEEFDLLNHPKAQKIWEKAVEKSDGEGIQNIYNELEDLTEFL
jgi:hypothetical protein